jgi:hypothetical protein
MEAQEGVARFLTLDDWHDSALLDSRWTLETVGVDTTEKLWLEVHGVEGVDGLIVVGLDLTCEAKSWSVLEAIERATFDFGATRATG